MFPGVLSNQTRPVTGDQSRVHFRQLTAWLLIPQRRDALIEQRQSLTVVALLVPRQGEVAADRQIAGVQLTGALQKLRRLGEIFCPVRLSRVGHQRFDLLRGEFGDALQPLFAVLGEHHVFRRQVMLPGLEDAALLLRLLGEADQPFRFRLLCFPLLLVNRDQK